MVKKKSYLVALDVFGFDKVEPAILAALVTEDPVWYKYSNELYDIVIRQYYG